ncbi:Dihydrofolate reductase type 3 [BD1-7 clade bacterium]|uniref:Dihydrofolate reductase n=1 Tax=BD1-7 clade bacterium TaxID=2029982 RepID=A0A5S9N3P5_9GAMM|nr:Dihydrofolate reductase type 3 [BD1-7 clade bacterium]CAA0084475.1 Dihydrofolate reductase type 3 [BD1-7 clade bacterium]
MKVAMMVAMAENGVIGKNNQLPWYLPEDLRWFKKNTLGKPIVMGRKTFESIGRPLPGRTNIVISRDASLVLPEGVRLATTLDEALEIAEAVALIDGVDELMVIGGQQIYALCMARADRLYLTKVHADVEGDATFEGFAESDWQEISQETHQASGANPHDYSFCIYQRAGC